MSQNIAGPGQGLPIAQNLYPSQLGFATPDVAGNKQTLFPGQALQVPPGDWLVDLGMYCVLQYQDPQNNQWTFACAPGWQGGMVPINDQDGFSFRVANLTGCPTGAVITSFGAGQVQATATITPTPNNLSTWIPLIGGQLTHSGTLATTNAGAGYGVPPLIMIPPPPPPQTNPNGVGGIQATAYAAITNGTVSTIVFTNPGAGYPSAPTVVVVPSPFDPNINVGITNATVGLTLTGAGSLTGVLCTNSGGTLANPANFTLTVGGTGTVGTLTPKVMQTITTASVTGIGTGFGASNTIALTTAGGGAPLGSITNSPEFLGLDFRPRPAQVSATTNAGGTLTTQNGTILDGGLFLSTPTAVLAAAPSGSVTAATLALTMGAKQDIIRLQPA